MIYPSIDKLLLHVDSKYRLVHVAAQRSNEISETGHLQMPEEDYVSSKNIGRALEEVEKDLIIIKTNQFFLFKFCCKQMFVLEVEMNITRYKFLGNGRYEVVIDNDRYIIYEDIILKYNVLGKGSISVLELNTYLKDNIFYEAYYKAVKYINVKLRTSREIFDYLVKAGYDVSLVSKVVDKIIKDGYINEEVYTECYINDQINLKVVGPLRIEKDLLGLGISKSVISKYIGNYSKEVQVSKINKFIAKEVKLNSNKSSYVLKNKILISLVNKGFYKDDIVRCLDNVVIDDSLMYEKEYKKTYDKLSKKYNGKELEYKVKQKMYQKGFRF